MSSTDAQLHEVFTSIQGEGVYLGERQVFIRFAGCNLSCGYCDSSESLVLSPEYKVEQTPGKHDFKVFKNPAPLQDLVSHVANITKPSYFAHSVSITGGEPLLQIDFLKAFLPELKKNKQKVYLETNGTLPQYLEEIIGSVDITSMDIKLPSSSGGTSRIKEHRAFLEIAYTKEVFVKVVVTPNTLIKEIEEAARMVSEIDAEIPFIIQPATPTKRIKHRPGAQDLLAWQTMARKHLNKVK